MKQIPNILSFARIAMIPWFIWEMFVRDNTLAAAIILAVSGLTDFLDGLLARKFGWVSQLGKILDPTADKLTQITVSIILALKLHQYWPFFAILLFKEFGMLILGGYLVKKGVKITGARWFGKAVTVLFYITMTSIVLIPSMPPYLSFSLLTLTTVFAIVSALLYIPQFKAYRREIPEKYGSKE